MTGCFDYVELRQLLPVAVVPISVEGPPPAAASALAAVARAVAVPPPAPLVGRPLLSRPRPPVLEVSPGVIDIRVSPRGEDLGDPRQNAPVPHVHLKLKCEFGILFEIFINICQGTSAYVLTTKKKFSMQILLAVVTLTLSTICHFILE